MSDEKRNLRPFGTATIAIAVLTIILGGHYLARDFLLLRADLSIDEYARLGRDFVNVWHGGQLVWQGRGDILYDLDAYRASLRSVLHVQGIYAYSYPPHSAFLAVPFSWLPYGLALALWTVLGLAAFLYAARPYLASVGLPWWLAALLPAGFVNLWAAHYGFFIGAGALIAWRLLENRPRTSALMFALITIKPHLGLLVPPAMLARRAWGVILWTALYAAALIALSAIMLGPELWVTYITRTLGFHAGLLEVPDMAFHLMMPTTAMAVIRLGASTYLVNAAQALTAIAALWIVIRCAMARIATTDLGLIAGTAIFLVLPYAFIYDMTVQSLAALIFAMRAHGSTAGRDRLVLAFAFILPLVQMELAAWRIGIAPLILLAALWVQAKIALSPPAGPATAGAAHSA